MRKSLPETFHLSMEGLLYKRRYVCTPGRTILPFLHTRLCAPTMSALPPSGDDWFTGSWLRDQECDMGLHSLQKNTDAADLRETHCSADQPDPYWIEFHESTTIPLGYLCAPWNMVYASYSSEYGLNYIAHLRELLAIGWSSDTVLGPAQTDADWLFTQPVMDTALPTLYEWISQVISSFEVLGVPEKLGLMILYNRYFKVSLHIRTTIVLADQD
jgi:hypothetical protein